VPPEDEDKVSLLLRTINELKRDVAYLKTSVKKHERLFGQLERKRSRKREEEEEESMESDPDPDPQQQEAAPPEEKAADGEDWFKAMRDALAEGDKASPSSAPLP
jgi:peptidoglycan hydrolase CwlO-like protein